MKKFVRFFFCCKSFSSFSFECFAVFKKFTQSFREKYLRLSVHQCYIALEETFQRRLDDVSNQNCEAFQVFLGAHLLPAGYRFIWSFVFTFSRLFSYGVQIQKEVISDLKRETSFCQKRYGCLWLSRERDP